MKNLVRFTIVICLLGFFLKPSRAAFNALYVFGDGICTTTNNPSPGPQYYGKRYTNGRVWIEVLAQRQGLTYDANKNWSYFGQDSSNLVANVSHYIAPVDVTNDLFIVWANDADFVGYLGVFYPPYTSANIPQWTNAMNVSLKNHFVAITNLYAKGVRTLIMPNAVDLMEIPNYDNFAATNRSFVRQRIIDYNSAFTNALNQAKAQCPDLTIYVPDVFSLLDNVLTNAAAYGLTNTLYNQGQGNVSIDAINYYNILGLKAATNGLGTNFIFWDSLDPTAQMHEVLADIVQQMISPVLFSGVGLVNGTNQLDMANVPIGRNGFVNGSTNLVNWASVTNINSTNAAETIFIPASGPVQFYRLSFPFAWSWP